MTSLNIKRYNEYLNSHRANEIITHTSMGEPKGKFCFLGLDYERFITLYHDVMDNHDLYMVERQLQIGPIVVDIDFKQKSKDRLYTIATMKKLIELYVRVINEYIDVTNEIKIFVLEKKNPTLDKNDVYKDGFHFIFPDIPVNVSFRYFILNQVKSLAQQIDIFNDIEYVNTYDEIFDKSVVIDNGLLMYGSKKPGREPYDLTHIYDSNLDEEDVNNYERGDILKILLLRRYDSDDEIIPIKEFNIVNKIKPTKQNNKLAVSTDNIKSTCKLLKDDKIAIKLVELLSDKRANEYHTWLYVGWALHNTNPVGLYDTFVNFSKRCKDKFDENACRRVWESSKITQQTGYTIASLYWWVKQDNPAKYDEFIKENVEELIKRAGSGTHDDIANLVYEIYKYNYKCISIKKDQWFEFYGHKWMPVESGYTLSEKISKDICIMFRPIINALVEKVTETGDQCDLLIAKRNKIIKITDQLKCATFKRQVMSLCAQKFYDKDFMSKLNDNPFLLGFDNGVYDLKNGYFRNGSPDDYISLSVGYDYKHYDKNDKIIKDILNYCDKVHVDIDLRECFLKLCASFCDGKPMQYFIFWTGGGANGKSTTQELLKKTFGEYYGILPHTIITKSRGKSCDAIPELADKAGKRCIFLQEPEEKDEIYCGQLKELTGSDTIMARALYGDPFYYKPQFQLCMLCNNLPNIKAVDGGTWRRIRVFPWESTFLDKNPSGPTEFLKEPGLEDKFEDWKYGFMWLLTNVYYPKYVKEKLYNINTDEEPVKILEHTKRYQAVSDIYLSFINSFIIKATPDDFENIDILYNIFKEYYKSIYSEKPPNKNIFATELTNKKYNIKNNRVYGIKIGTINN